MKYIRYWHLYTSVAAFYCHTLCLTVNNSISLIYILSKNGIFPKTISAHSDPFFNGIYHLWTQSKKFPFHKIWMKMVWKLASHGTNVCIPLSRLNQFVFFFLFKFKYLYFFSSLRQPIFTVGFHVCFYVNLFMRVCAWPFVNEWATDWLCVCVCVFAMYLNS